MTTGPRRPATELLRRAEEAKRQRRYREAADLYRQAEAALGPRAEPQLRVEVWSRVALCHQLSGALAEAEEALFETIGVARQHDLPEKLHGLLGQLGLVVAERGRPKEAAGFHREALEVATDLEDVRGLATHLGNLGILAAARGDVDEARRSLKQALEAYVSLGDANSAANALNSLGEVERSAGDESAARAAFLEAMDLWEASGSHQGQALAASNLGNLDRVAGRLSEASEQFELALGLSAKAGDVRGEARALTNLGNLAALRGERAEARRCYEASAARHERIGFPQGLAVDRVNLASLALEEGRLLEARERYAVARQHFASTGAERARIDLTGLVAQIDARLGELDEAQRGFEEAAAAAERAGYPAATTRSAVNLASLAFIRGDLHTGLAGQRRGLAEFQALEMPSEALSCRLALAEALWTTGDSGGARHETSQALVEAARLGFGRAAREAAALGARMELEQSPTEEGRDRLLAMAAELEGEGRTLDGLSLRLTVLDFDVEDGRQEAWHAQVLALAERVEARPLLIEVQSLLAGDAETPQPSVPTLEALEAEASQLGLVLTRLRVARRLALASAKAGDLETAGRRFDETLAAARAMGAGAEEARLLRLAPRFRR